MSLKNCQACEELRNDAPNMIVNGFTDTEVTSLMNNTGLNPASGNNDCTDLNNLNDCLIGNMEAEVDAYDVCDWKPFQKAFIPNVWNVFKGVISAICGLWKRVNRLECETNYIINGTSFSIGEDETAGSYIVAGKGVSYTIPTGESELTSDLNLLYIGGGLIRFTGSFQWFTENFTEPKSVINFDNGETESEGINRQGNVIWGTQGACVNGGELICEIRLKNSEFPQIKRFFFGFGQEQGATGYHLRSNVFTEGMYAYGQHGNCLSDGTPAQSGYSHGHIVPDGWTYIQMRMTYILDAFPNNVKYSPVLFMGVRINRDGIEC